MPKSFRSLMFEAKPETKPIIMLDLDGVLVDLNAGIKRLTGGLDLDAWKKRSQAMKDSRGNVPQEVSHNQLWRMVQEQGPRFWANLPWTKDGKALWKFVSKHDVHILSAYKRVKNDPLGVSKTGKTLWVEKNLKGLPSNKVHLVFRDDKQKYTKYKGQPALLIDDYTKNTREFEAAGGVGVHHKSASHTIRQLKSMGFE